MPKNKSNSLRQFIEFFSVFLRHQGSLLPFPVAGRDCSERQTAEQNPTARTLPAPKKRNVKKAGLRPSQLVLLQVIKLHIAEVNVILHRKLRQKVMLEPQMTNGFNRKANSRGFQVTAWLLDQF